MPSGQQGATSASGEACATNGATCRARQGNTNQGKEKQVNITYNSYTVHVFFFLN